jgi:hypothetical protein
MVGGGGCCERREGTGWRERGRGWRESERGERWSGVVRKERSVTVERMDIN